MKIPGIKSRKFIRELHKYECPGITYIDRDFPVIWHRGKGMFIEDIDKNQYLDLTAAFGVVNLGHNHPAILKAIREQSRLLIHGMGDVHPTEIKIQLIKKLAEITPGDLQQTILSSSGSEAIESALKTVLITTGKAGIIAFSGAYHGLTYGALQLTGIDYFKTPFKKHLNRFVIHLPYPDLYRNSDENQLKILEDKIRNIVNNKSKSNQPIGGLIIEPILGRGGLIIPPDNFLIMIRNICDELELIMIVDEIYTGFGRTGEWFAVNHANIIPDILCLGKGLANGFPISACIGKNSIMKKWDRPVAKSVHTSTFLGNPMGCAMALATIYTMQKNNFIFKSKIIGDYFLNKLLEEFIDYPMVGHIRGKGLMIGIELVKNKKTKIPDTDSAIYIMKSALKKGLILLPCGPLENILSFTPPLIIRQNDIKTVINILHSCFRELR